MGRTPVVAVFFGILSFGVALFARADGVDDCNYQLLPDPQAPTGWVTGAGCPSGPCPAPGGGNCVTDTGYVPDTDPQEYFAICFCDGGTANAACMTVVHHNGAGTLTQVSCYPNNCAHPKHCQILPVGTGPIHHCQCN